MKIRLSDSIEKLKIIVLLLAIFPNDYKHGSRVIELLFYVLPLTILFFDGIRYFNFIKSRLQKYWYVFMPFFIQLIASLLNNNSIVNALYNIYGMLLVLMGLIYFEKRPEFIQLAERVSFIILLINFAIMYFHGPMSYTASGGRIYFIFEGSTGTLTLVNMLFFFSLVNKKKWDKLIHHVLYFLIILTLFNVSVTYPVCVSLLLIYAIVTLYVREFKHMAKFIRFFLFVIIVLNIFIVNGQMNEFIANFFGKTASYSGRIYIWEAVSDIVTKNWLMGIGVFDSNYLVKITGIRGATHAHNQLLQILLNCGILGMMCYGILGSKLFNIKKKYQINRFLSIYVGYLLVILIGCIMDPLFNSIFYLVTLIALYQINEE